MFSKAIIVGTLASLAAAQTASTVLGFNVVPNPITEGSASALTWHTNDTASPVTILLRQGVASNLQTVQVLTTDGRNGQYIWTPCTALPNGFDYALEIEQAGQFNYFGPFEIQGYTGQGTCTSLVSSSTSSSASSSATGNSTAALTSSASSNNTASSTITSAASTGTGSSGSHNTTMSSATLTAPSSTGTQTGSMSSASAPFQSPKPTGAASSLLVGGSSVAMLFGAAAMFLA